jgi:ATP-dependent Clp protease ATP-binding subunit ClpA
VFERFTKQARQVVTGAIEEARRHGDSRVGTEHLLIGVATSGRLPEPWPDVEVLRDQLDRLDAEALRSVGLDPDLLQEAAASPVRVGRAPHIPFTGAAKDILKGALKEAIALGHRHIGVEHIALALLTGSGPDRARAIIAGLGLSPDALRDSLVRAIRKAS